MSLLASGLRIKAACGFKLRERGKAVYKRLRKIINDLSERTDEHNTNDKDKKPTVVNDWFAQCEKCKYWVRLRPLDQDGYRPIPLRNWFDLISWRYDNDVKRERWVCQQCYDTMGSIRGVVLKPK